MNLATIVPILLSTSCVNGPGGTPKSDFFRFHSRNVFASHSPTDDVPLGSHNCPGNDMIEIEGEMTIDGPEPVDSVQQKSCKKWGVGDFSSRCLEFDGEKLQESLEGFPRKDMHFCIDPYEWPNRKGRNPRVMVTWDEAGDLCRTRGKRLCTEDEWTFSCEGWDTLPYSYGYVRDNTKCNIDKQWRAYDHSLLFPRFTNKSNAEVLRLWQGNRSGEYKGCVSEFGVYDLDGNVEEWTVSSRPDKYPSILKGGYWSDVRARCRPAIRTHGPGHAFYQSGFRCCSDPKTSK